MSNSIVPKNFILKNHINLDKSDEAINALEKIDNVLKAASTAITKVVHDFYVDQSKTLQNNINSFILSNTLSPDQNMSLEQTISKQEKHLQKTKIKNGKLRC